jgi:Peptidase C13 family
MSENESTSQPGEAIVGAGSHSRSWFMTLLRLWSLQKVGAAPHGNPVLATFVMCLVWLSAWVAIDWWERRPDPTFYVYGVPLLAWFAVAVLALAGLLRWRSRSGPGIAVAITLATGLVPLPMLLLAGTYWQPTWFWWANLIIGIYAFLYLARGLRAVTGQSQGTAAWIGAIGIVAFIGVSDAVNAIPDVWNPRDADASVSDELISERETALFEQAARIDEALESVHRDTSARSEAFFLGFAGVGDEKVFAQEIGLASRVLGERYGIGDRHLSLINDERDLERAPLASVSGLVYALHGLASHMDLDRDVLFLAISSHGSEEPAIAVSNSEFPLKDLGDEELAEALRESGIKWRVIMISACYAGGFINSLRDPQTIVITAAAADRSSFGCSNDSDLTYFGEAFYRDALPGARSLRDAFEKAKEAITAREHAEGETPSNPQAYFGTAIETKLATLGVTAP